MVVAARGWARRAHGWAQRACPQAFFLFFIFDLSRRASNHLGKCPIYYDLMSEAVAMPALVNLFCPPRIIFCVVVTCSELVID